MNYDDPIHMMDTCGGSFVKALAACYYRADSENKRRLKEAFADYFSSYESKWRAMQPKQQEMT